MESDIQLLRVNLERQGKLTDGIIKESDQYNLNSYQINSTESKPSGI